MKKYSKFLIFAFFIITILVSICFVPFSVSKLIPIVEEQVEKELGVKTHIERLILRFGPSLKIKAPIIHIMYPDGQKFAQFDNVKLYVPWTSFIKNNLKVSLIKAKKLIVKTSSNDAYLVSLLNKLQSRDYNDIPDVYLKEYSCTFENYTANDSYKLEGQNLEINKIFSNKNFKLKTKGSLAINSHNYVSYDVIVTPNIEKDDLNYNINALELLEQIKSLDFHSDIIADLKLYKNQANFIQASGFINIDNMSVLDKSKKYPKSFIYLTLWGDKASVLSNIYTSQSQKVYIEGVVKNTKKPVLDLKVKTDDININDLYQKLKIFADYSIIKEVQSVTGLLNANFTLKGDLNKIKSNGYIKITNAGIKASGVQIDDINSDIDLSNNTINIKKAVGFVNKAPIIVKGNINKNVDIEILMNKVDLKYLCPSKLGIKNGVASLIAKISGTLENLIHKENISIDNLKISNNNYNLSIDSFKIDTNKNNVAYINNIFCNTSEIEQIKVPSMKIFINDDEIKISETKIYMPNSLLISKGEIFNIGNNLTFIANINGFINSKDIKSLSKYSSKYPIKININGNKQYQNVNSQVLIEKTDILDEPVIVNLISKIEKNILKLEDLSLIAFSGKFSDDYKLNIKGAKKISITGAVDIAKEPCFKNLRIFIPQQLNLNIFDTIAQLKGDVFINGSLQKPEIVGQINILNLINQAIQLALSNSTLDFNKNNFIVNAPQIKLGDSSIGLNALLSTDFSKSILVKNINIKSKYINTDTILMHKDNPFINFYPIEILDGKFYAERLLANIYSSPLYLTSFSADLKLNKNIIFIKNISSELFNGKLSGTLNYNLRDEHFDTQIMARNVSAEPIFNIISTRKDTINGIMDFDTDIKGELTSKQSLKGNIKFIVNNGRMSTLGKLEHLLYAQNVIADNMLRTSLSVVTKAITLKDTGLFKYLRGDVDLNDGVAHIKMLQSQGPLMALFIKGYYNTLNDYANLIVLGRLSDEIISGLGAFGDFSLNKLMIMLTGEETRQNVTTEDFDKIPQLPIKNTKEFKSVINGLIDKSSSVISFNWISYSQKSLKQKEVPLTDTKLPEFLETLPY